MPIPTSVLWEHGAISGGATWQSFPGQTFLQLITGEAIDGSVQTTTHVGSVYALDCLKEAVNADETPDGTNCCRNCKAEMNGQHMLRRLRRRKQLAEGVGRSRFAPGHLLGRADLSAKN